MLQAGDVINNDGMITSAKTDLSDGQHWAKLRVKYGIWQGAYLDVLVGRKKEEIHSHIR